jgi:hypothetical protein
MSQTLSTWRTPPGNKTLGIEIEGYKRNPQYYEYNGFFYFTRDGSLNEPPTRMYGVEMVSQPLTPCWLKKEIKKLEKKDIWQVNDTCGIHIHVNRKWLSEKKAKKISSFLSSLSNDDWILFFGRKSNRYCTKVWDRDSRYSAINVSNTHTIEFRMFSSGDAQWACYCVDMAVYLIDNANHLNVHAMEAFRAGY